MVSGSRVQNFETEEGARLPGRELGGWRRRCHRVYFAPPLAKGSCIGDLHEQAC